MFRCSRIILLGLLVCSLPDRGATLRRGKRQSEYEEGGGIIDNIFNIPITAIKQTAAAAQTFSPENSQAIDSVVNIPVSTLEAVGNLVKASSNQRRQNAEELQRIREERREKLLAQREQQRLQREQLQQQRFKQQQTKRTIKFNGKDPFGLNALSALVSGHGILGGFQGVFGGHGAHGNLGAHGGLGGHGGHGGHGGLGGHGGHGQGGASSQNTYEVHEHVEEDTNYTWHGITAGIGSFVGSRPTSTHFAIQNKVAPKVEHRRDSNSNRGPNRFTTNEDGFAYQDDPPLRNKIAPRSGRIAFRE